jgi:hypothetical protein
VAKQLECKSSIIGVRHRLNATSFIEELAKVKHKIDGVVAQKRLHNVAWSWVSNG